MCQAMRGCMGVSTHSRPKAAGYGFEYYVSKYDFVSTHSRPKAAGNVPNWHLRYMKFQLTAARRRLAAHVEAALQGRSVSTHSRPKAAGFYCHTNR